ncbi:MAG: type IV secretion system DNA-binding domain-containing protein [Janthinobacterium lividum]
MPIFHNVTRGGQVHIHQLRMIRQVIWFALMMAFISSAGYLSFKTYHMVPNWAWQTLWEYHVAELNVSTQPLEKKKLVRQKYYSPGMMPYERTSLSILQDKAISKVVQKVEGYLSYLCWDSLKIGGWSFLVALLGWSTMGYYHRRKKKHRGNELVSVSSLARKLRWTFKASDLKLGKLPLIKNSETSHILLSGTTGAGKSNAFHTLLPQVRARRNAAIIVDVEGDMVARYFREGKDVLLNPFDARGQCWDLWGELERDSLYKVFAQAVIPPNKDIKDKFWENASRKLLIAALRKFKQEGRTSPRQLYETLIYSDPEEFEAFFKGTEAATYAQEKGERLTISVRGSLEQYLDFFKDLPDPQGRKSFSIRKWIQDPKNYNTWLFFSCREEDRPALLPLLSGWSDLAMSALMSLPKDRARRLWLVLDELPALNALPCLMSSLARTRKYGGCVIAGVQNFKQLDLTYGRTESEVLMDLFNTKVFFRNGESGTAEWVAKTLGEREETEVIENLSYGANTMRDGVSLNQQTKRTPLVIPTEVTMLKDLEAYIKLPGHYPITKGKMPLVKAKNITEDFVPL